MYQAGTLSGNPVAVAAGLATLAAIEAPGFYEALAATHALAHRRPRGRGEARRRAVLRAVGRRHVRPLFRARACPTSYDTVMACDKERFNRFFHAMLDAGVYLAPSAFEAGFVSAAHTADDIATTVALAEHAFAASPRLTLPGVELSAAHRARACVASRCARPKASSGSHGGSRSAPLVRTR